MTHAPSLVEDIDNVNIVIVDKRYEIEKFHQFIVTKSAK